MPFRGTVTLTLDGLFLPESYENIKPIVGIFAAEKGLKAACEVIKDNAKSLIFQRLKQKSYGGLYDSMIVRGSYRGKYVPSARVSGAPHLHLIEEGHRIVIPHTTRDRSNIWVRGPRIPRKDGGKFTGKYARPFLVVADAVPKNRGQQVARFIHTVNKEMEKEFTNVQLGSTRSAKQAERYFLRVLKREVDKPVRR